MEVSQTSRALTVQTAQAMTIPAKAVLPQTSGEFHVFVLQPDSTVCAQRIETGTCQSSPAPNTTRAEVIRGLKVGDTWSLLARDISKMTLRLLLSGFSCVTGESHSLQRLLCPVANYAIALETV